MVTNKSLKIIIVLSALTIGSVLLLSLLPGKNKNYVKPVEKTTTKRVVNYEVHGNKNLVISVTQASEDGATSQFNNIKAPYKSGPLLFKKGDFVYLSAQNQNNSGEVTVEIFVDSRLYKSTRSVGEYCIASVSGKIE